MRYSLVNANVNFNSIHHILVSPNLIEHTTSLIHLHHARSQTRTRPTPVAISTTSTPGLPISCSCCLPSGDELHGASLRLQVGLLYVCPCCRRSRTAKEIPLRCRKRRQVSASGWSYAIVRRRPQSRNKLTSA
jgi:hypothetical protein